MTRKEKRNQLTFEDRTGLFPGIEELFSSLLDHICETEKLQLGAVESLTLADDDFVKEVNREYRGIDRTTDVISFSFEEGEEATDLPFRDLGDLVISVQQAQRQAEEFKHPLSRELAFLFIHGTLHNLGYDHVRSEEDATIMFELQNRILNSFVTDWEDARWKPTSDPLEGTR